MTIKNNYEYSEYMAKCVQSTNTDVIETRHIYIMSETTYVFTVYTQG